MLPQKLGILLALLMLRSDSHTVSSTHVLQNSSLQTSNLTHPSTSCHNCESNVLYTVTIFSCCTYRTVLFFFLFFNAYFCWISLVPPKTSSLCQGTHRNKMDTFQCINQQLCRLYLQYFI